MTAWRLFKSGKFGEVFVRSLKVLKNSSIKYEVDYTKWHRTWVDLNNDKRNQILESIKSLPEHPSFTIFLPVDNANPSLLFRTIQSIRAQLYPNWSLFITNNTLFDPDFSTKIDSLRDSRIKLMVLNDDVSNCDVPTDWIVELSPDTQLHEAALFVTAVSSIENPKTKIMYCDHDHLNVQGEYCDPHMKPRWNPDLFAAINYMTPFVICEKELWETNRDKEDTQHDFLLKATKTISDNAILHMPYVLTSVYISDDRSHLSPVVRKVEHSLPIPEPLVSILIPTRDQGKLLGKCLQSLYDKTDYQNFEVVLIDHESSEKSALKIIETYREKENFRLIEFSGSFNFSAMMNQAASLAKGQILVLLNNDTEVLESAWLRELASQVSRPDVGIVGALLLFGDGSIQHAGVHPGVGGLMGHGHKHLSADSTGYFNRLKAVHEVSAVTGACLAIKKSFWDDLGGLDEQNLTVAYNDIDLCLKARQKGFRIIFTPFAKLMHHESVSRGSDDDPAVNERLNQEINVMLDRWGDLLEFDPAYSPNLSLEDTSFALSEEPRTIPMWKKFIKNPL